ncbi:hypothetical protein I302_107557 [Kwoniella bestiolae CBS 10118]|uniref:F-box domain-containing protein n=1 Tax=Kwoniella bestiolae CBS 10118 TaxID=1296100 RepID=A0A1B9FY64_9TREE|nr:hypothetical protein I302_06701 [Kwoniella bestiolae CBS 10118]OCF23718.1 hypothetical protein I302_06701 [Kwoniella bestiolae CBS 10118]
MSEQSPTRLNPLTHPDILSHILRYVDQSTLSTSMRVSWAFFHVAAPFLYSKLSIIPNNADSIFRAVTIDHITSSSITERRGSMKRNLFGLVRNLSVGCEEDCNGPKCRKWSDEIDFPSLEILRLWINPYSTGYMDCSWLSTLSPKRKLIVRDVQYLSNGEPFNFLPCHLLRTAQKLVLTMRSFKNLRETNHRILSSSSTSPCPRHTINPDIEIVLIFWTDRPSEKWLHGSYDSPLNSYEVDNILEQITICLLVDVRRFIICNVDKLALSDGFFRDRLEGMVRRVSSGNGVAEDQAQKILGKIEFMAFEEYLGKEEWQGEFDDDEVERYQY